MSAPAVRVAPAVARAVAGGAPVVALESSVLAHGLPIPANADAERRMTSAVREAGAVPAVAAVVRGVPTLGLEGDDLERFLRRDGIAKLTARDLAGAMARGADGATTVAATLALIDLAGIAVFATGGIGGVHRDAPGDPDGPAYGSRARDESADLVELARVSAVVVCSGAKSILDLPATLERLETLGVTTVGFRTGEFPGFFYAETGLLVPQRVESAADVARLYRAHRALRRPGAVLVVQPPPTGPAMDRAVVESAVGRALDAARAAEVRGSLVTPFLLRELDRQTAGRSLTANLALLEANARLAGEIAVALACDRAGE